MGKYRGSISIFLVIIWMTLMVFGLSMVEVTRYQIVSMQATRTMMLATEALLAGYDSRLKNEYGIFARNPYYSDMHYLEDSLSDGEIDDLSDQDGLTQDLIYYLDENNHNDVRRLETSLLDQLIENQNSNSFLTNQLQVQGALAVGTSRIGDEDLTYLKDAMVTYMHSRLPIMALRPMLEQLGALEKMGKSTALLQEKNQTIRQAATIEEAYLKLYEAIDGVVIDPTNGSMKDQAGNSVNRLQVREGDAPMGHLPGDFVYNPPLNLEYESESLMGGLQSVEAICRKVGNNTMNYRIVKESLAKVMTKKSKLEDDRERVNEVMSDLRKQLNSILIEIENLNDEQEVEELQRQQALFENQIQSKEEELIEILKELREVLERRDLLDEQKAQLKEQQVKDWLELTQILAGIDRTSTHLFVPFLQPYYSYENSHLSGIATIERIELMGTALELEIDATLEKLENDKEAILPSVYEATKMELTTLEQAYTTNVEKQYRSLGNLRLIKEGLENNLELLKACHGRIENLQAMLWPCINQIVHDQGLDQETMILTKEMVGYSTYHEVEQLLEKSGNVGISQWPETTNEIMSDYEKRLEEIVKALGDYTYIQNLDYSGYESSVEEADDGGFLAVYDQIKNFSNHLGFDHLAKAYVPEEVLLPDGLPSSVLSGQKVWDMNLPQTHMTEDYEKQEAVDLPYNEMTDWMYSGWAGLKDIDEGWMLGEYAIGMFRSYPDRHRDMPETLSGYNKLAHLYPTELEYIITGERDSRTALMMVSGQIFLMRLATNSLHLATDPAKRTTITTIANMLGSWWSLGIAGLIIGVIVGLVWAMAESFADLALLLKGERVPLFKVRSNWITSVEGGADLLLNLGIQGAQGVVDAVADDMHDKIEMYINQITHQAEDEVQDLIEETLLQSFEEGEKYLDSQIVWMEEKFYEAMDACLYAYEQGNLSQISPEDFLPKDHEGYSLLAQIIITMKQYLNSGVSYTYLQLIELKDQVIEGYRGRIEALKTTITQRLTAITHNQMEVLVTKANDTINEGKDKSVAYIKGIISEQGEIIRTSMRKKLMEAGMSEQLQDNMNHGLSEVYIPSISYEDYCRLLMLIHWEQQDLRVYRMMDLMALNLADDGSGILPSVQDLRLQDYSGNVKARVTFTIPVLMMNLPIPAWKEHWNDDHYIVTIEMENAYE